MSDSTSTNIVQIPPQAVLDTLVAYDTGKYSIELPQALCFGIAINGGFIATLMHRGATSFVSQNSKTSSHQDLWQAGVTFFRPTFPSPNVSYLNFRMASGNKKWTTIHAELVQNDKVCAVAYLTLTNLSAQGYSIATNWEISPPIAYPVSLEDLEADRDPNWVSYQAPFDGTSVRYGQAYFKTFYPVKRDARNIVNHWMTPGWTEEGQSPRGAVWTDELLHFMMDNSMPCLQDLADRDEGGTSTWYDNVIAAGLEQRQARAEGKVARPWGHGLTDADITGRLISTIVINTQVQKKLPKEGVKWLFMRSITKSVVNDRTDYDITVLDEGGECVAVSQHTMTVLPGLTKQVRTKAVL